MRALSMLGAPVLLALASMAGAGGLPISVAYVGSYAATAPDDQILDFVKSLDLPLEKTNTYQVNFPGLGPFNVNADLSKTYNSGFNQALYSQKISHRLLTAYFEDIGPQMKTVPSTVSFPSSSEGGPPNGAPGPGSGYCSMSASNSPSGTAERVNLYAWYHPDSSTYRVLATASGKYTWVSIDGNQGSAINSYNSYIAKCINPPRFNEWMTTKKTPDSDKVLFGRAFINGYLQANPFAFFVAPPPFTIGPNFTYTKETDICTPSTCDPATDTGGGTTNPGTGTGTTSPACTRADGTTSGNPYDCAPTDPESNCTLFQPMCWLKKGFVPSEDFFKNGLNDYANKRLLLPVKVVSEISMETGNPMFPKIGLNFKGFDNPTTTSILKLIAWFQVAFWILNYLGFPNPFGGSRRGDGYVGSPINSAYQDSAAADRANTEADNKGLDAWDSARR